MKLIPIRGHGVLDYLTAATLFVLPKMLGWDDKVSSRVRVAAVGTLLYSLVTRYELGLKPIAFLPVPGHLALDGTSGVLFCAAPLLLPDEPRAVKNILGAIGIFELLITLNTQTQPKIEGDPS